MTHAFISYSHKDKRWLDRLRVHLRPLERDGYIFVFADTDIKASEEWLARIRSALREARVAILLVSADFLASEFIASREFPALLQKAKRRECKIFSMVLGYCGFSDIRDLQQFQAINPPDRPLAMVRKGESERSFADLAREVRGHLVRRAGTGRARRKPSREFVGNPRIDDLVRNVRLGDWDAAAESALKVIAETDSKGRNKTFEALLTYRDCLDEDKFWGAAQTVESCARIAPWLINHAHLSRMASHRNFSVRSNAASICMDLAHIAPDRVPLDILQRLSVYKEDWYVQAPANAALKAMAHAFPDVLRIFYTRVHSVVEEERKHALTAIEDVAKNEPGLLVPDLLRSEITRLKKLDDTRILKRMQRALSKARAAPHTDQYRYTI